MTSVPDRQSVNNLGTVIVARPLWAGSQADMSQSCSPCYCVSSHRTDIPLAQAMPVQTMQLTHPTLAAHCDTSG